MGQLRDDAKNIEPIQSESETDFSDTETVPYDSEVPPPQLPDELDGDIEMESDGLQYFQDTVPVDDAFPYGDAFETQKVDLDGETQVMDVCNDTQVVNLDGDTQVINDYDAEVLIESDGAESDETEVLCDTQKLSEDESETKGGTCSVSLKNMLNTNLSRKSDGDSKAQLGSLSNKGHDSGSTVRGFTSIRVASIRQSGLAARKGGMLSCRDSTTVGNDANQKNSPEENDQRIKELQNEKMSKFGSSAARKLFMDDVLTEIQQADDDMENPDGTGSVSNFTFQHDPAGLSYISSQEPGDLSQANALDIVDRFLELNAVESDQDVTFTKSEKEKSKPVSIAKGTQSLARRATVRSIDGESRIFKWDDNLEDEGGGEFFQKKKELFFEKNSVQRKRSVAHCRKASCLNSKGSLTTQQNRDKKQIGCNRKLKDAIFSDSRLLTKNSRAIIESSELTKPSFIKNLIEELNEEMNTTGDRLLDAGSGNGMPKNQDVGFDTQMAADAMETLQFAVSMTENVSINSNVGSRKMRKSSDRNEENELQSLDKSSTKKRACPSNAKVVTRQSKRMKGTDESSRGSSLSSLNQSKNASKQSDAELSKRESRRAKGELKNLVRNDCEKLSPVAEVVQRRKENGVPVASDLHDGTHATVSSGRKYLKTNPSQDELGSFTPISHRTRGSTKVSRSKGENKQNSSVARSNVCELGDVNLRQLGQSDTFSRGKRTRSKLSVVGQEASTQYNTRSKRSKIDSSPSYVDLIQHQKEQSSECADRRILDKMIDNDKSLDKNSSHIKESMVKAQVSRHSGAKRDVDNILSAEGGKVNRCEEASPIDRSKPYASANTTPINSVTPISAASPICMGDEYHKQSCRRNLLTSSLMKEINGMNTAACPEFTSAVKDLRKRRDITDVRAMFSRHLDAAIIKHQKKILARLGASVASSMSDATHFITDKFVRTRNMLEAIAYGKPVVTQLWLESCGQANCLIDERTHILRDAKKEREFGFSMPVSLARARQHPLLQGQRVLITPNTKPGKEILASLVKAVRGLAVERLGRSALKDERLPDDILVLSCEEDYEICVPFLEKGAAVYSSELLLNGIVTQLLEYERHRLFMDSVKRTRSTIWLKKNGHQYLPVSKSR